MVSGLTPARQALCHCAASSTHFLLCIWRQVCSKQFKMTLNSPCRSCRPWIYCSQSLISRVAGITGLQTGLACSMAYINPLQYKSHAAQNSSIVNVLFLTFGSECLQQKYPTFNSKLHLDVLMFAKPLCLLSNISQEPGCVFLQSVYVW